jgi:hypothetical protein
VSSTLTRLSGQPEKQDWSRPLVKIVIAILGAGLLRIVAALLFSVTAVWLASFGRTFTKYGAGPLSTGAEDPATALNAASVDIDAIGKDVGAIARDMAELADRLSDLEQRAFEGSAREL